MPDVSFQITGDPSQLLNAFEQAKTAAQEAASGIGDRFGALTEQIGGLKEAFAGLIAGFGAHEIVEQLSQISERAEDIKNTAADFGLSTTALQGLQAAAAKTGVTSDTLGTAMGMLQSRMSQAAEMGGQTAERFTALGITLTQMRDPSFSVIDAMTQMGAAANSNTALLAALGNRGMVLIPLLRELATNHNLVAQSAQQVGALMPYEIEQLADYQDAVSVAGIQWENFKTRVLGEALPAAMAMVGALAEFQGPATRAAKSTDTLGEVIIFIGEQCLGFTRDVQDLTDIIAAEVGKWVALFEGAGKAIEDGLHGHFGAAKQDLQTAAREIKDDWDEMYDSINQNAERFNQRLDQMKIAVSGLSEVSVLAQKMQATQLAPLPNFANAKDDIEKSLQEIARDEEQLNQKMLSSDEAYFAGQVKLAEQAAGAERDAQLASLTRQQSAVDEAYKSHQIGAQQDLQQTQAIIAEELQARMAYYQQLETLAAGDQAKLSAIGADEAKTQEKYLEQMQQAQQQYTQHVEQSWQQMGSRISSVLSENLTKVLSGTETMAKMMQNIFASVVESMIQSLVKLGMQMLVNEAISKATGQSAARSNIMANAAQAASGAMASAASIPYIGWLIAPIEGAAAYAAALAFPSAARGYDIPSGINPVTQLHEREMVLPAQLADVVRRMAGSGRTWDGTAGGSSGGGDLHLHMGDSLDAASFHDYVHRPEVRDSLVSTLREALRGGHPALQH